MAHKTKILKIIFKAFVVILILLIVSLGWYDQSRSFYCFEKSKCLTVWKRLGNKCFLIPGRYYGMIKPSKYIKTTNENALTLIFRMGSSEIYAISNNYNEKVYLNIPKTQYFDYNERDSFVNKFYIDGKIDNRYNYIKIDIKENFAIVNGVRK